MRRPRDNGVRRVILEAVRRGCTVEPDPTGGGHGVLRGPDGRLLQRFPLGRTDPRAWRNLRAALRREGVDLQ